MRDSGKYLIHAAIAADGVVERSDVVGAIYGQTEGLIGEELDLRRLQQSSKLGRIDVELDVADGKSVGEITVATSLDRVETATLAAALETIDRVGPCRATVEVTDLEDVRAATRREVVERAEELLLSEFEETTSEAIVDEVRRRVATADVEEYEGLPAGPRVPDADAVVLVEGRADVQAVLAAGVKNAVAVEGTNVPEVVAELTDDRTATAFLDGDRGGELILRELRQVADVDYVAFAPPDRSVEDLSRSEVLAALRSKVPLADVDDAASAREVASDARARASGGVVADEAVGDAEAADAASTDAAAVDAGVEPAGVDAASGQPAADPETGPDADAVADGAAASGDAVDAADAAAEAATEPPAPDADVPDAATDAHASEADAAGPAEDAATGADGAAAPGADDASEADAPADAEAAPEEPGEDRPRTLREHVEAVSGTDRARLLDADLAERETVAADEAFDALRDADEVPPVLVLGAELDQRLLDVAAQRGVGEVVADALGSFTKRPTDVRLRTADDVLSD